MISNLGVSESAIQGGFLAAKLRPWVGAIATWFVVVAVAVVLGFYLRKDAISEQTRQLSLLSLALADEIDRGLAGIREGFAAIRSEIEDGRVKAAGPDTPQLLRTRADLMPIVDRLWILDVQGRLLSSSDTSQAPQLASFVPALGSSTTSSLGISRPFEDEVSHTTMLALAVRFADSPGAPGGGWIVGSIPAATLLGAFASASLVPETRMAVFREDGARLAALNFGMPGQDAKAIADRLDDVPNGATQSFRDGSENLVSIRSVPREHLKVVVALDRRDVLSKWLVGAEASAVALLLLLVLILVAVNIVALANRRRAQAQLEMQTQRLRATRLESLGRLAGGVAHDFNNVLAGVIGFTEMAHAVAVPESRQARHLDKALQAALRGKTLVEKILSFSVGGAQASTVFVLKDIVDEVLGLTGALLPVGIVLERDLQAADRRIHGDPMQAFDAVMNLCTNAIHAMPRGGVVSVRLDAVLIDEASTLSHSELGPGRYLALAVADQGAGIDEDGMEHLFEPFYTTRGLEGGTGLGLATVHGAVAEFRGGIDVRSPPGRGATFTLYFPESTEPLEAPTSRAADTPPGKGERLLLVDDEPNLVEMGTEMLRDLGYVATGTSDPLDALAQIEKNPGRFALLITDESMPSMNGTELATILRRSAPDLPILIVSGYGGVSLANRAKSAGATLLAKPLQRASLAATLSIMLS